MVGFVNRTRGNSIFQSIRIALGGAFFANAQDTLTARAGGGQALATQITQSFSRFTTVATAADSGKLLVSASGQRQTVTNSGANSMNVFPATGEQINGGGANAAFALAAGKTADFICYTAGAWFVNLSA